LRAVRTFKKMFLQLGTTSGFGETLLGLFEVDDIPDCFEIINLDVEILEVEGMLPDVNADDGDMAEERILVSGSYDLQALGGGTVTKPSPTRTLDPSSGGVELGLEFVDAAKGTLELALEVAILEDATISPMLWIGGKVLPEEGVVDVTTAVELESSLKGDALFWSGSFGVCSLRGVKCGDIGLMMLLVVKSHDLFLNVLTARNFFPREF